MDTKCPVSRVFHAFILSETPMEFHSVEHSGLKNYNISQTGNKGLPATAAPVISELGHFVLHAFLLTESPDVFPIIPTAWWEINILYLNQATRVFPRRPVTELPLSCKDSRIRYSVRCRSGVRRERLRRRRLREVRWRMLLDGATMNRS